MSQKKNVLDQKQKFKLVEILRRFSAQPFREWPPAVNFFQSQAGHKLTRSNIVSVITSLDMDMSKYVVPKPINLLTSLESRVEKIEERLMAIEEALTK